MGQLRWSGWAILWFGLQWWPKLQLKGYFFFASGYSARASQRSSLLKKFLIKYRYLHLILNFAYHFYWVVILVNWKAYKICLFKHLHFFFYCSQVFSKTFAQWCFHIFFIYNIVYLSEKRSEYPTLRTFAVRRFPVLFPGMFKILTYGK